MAHWTPAQIPDQSGRVAVVTGATSGLGLHTAEALADRGAHVVLACRDTVKGAGVAQRIGGSTEVERLDLADLAAVRTFAWAMGERHPRVDLLVNNAGVMALPRRETRDGFEMQLGTNHLGHFALTGLLLDRLRAADAPRVVTVSSGAHRMGRIAFDDLQSTRRYQRWAAYGQSKLANLLFALELQRRATAAGLPLLSVAAHPGYAATNLQLAGPRMESSRPRELLGRMGNLLFGQSAAAGALPTLYAATAPDLPPAAYVGPDGPFEARGGPTLVGMNEAAQDAATAARLWAVSEELTGVRYDLAPAAAVA